MDSVEVPGYPRYHILSAKGDYVQVRSFCKNPDGKLLQPCIFNGAFGFKLWNEEGGKVFTFAQLKTIVERFKLKKVREEMNTTYPAKFGSVQTGDWIVGSLDKASGNFSTSAIPARHVSEAAAKQEAARLSTVNKGKKFVVLKVAAIASAVDVSWE